jgi:hypothetical protein
MKKLTLLIAIVLLAIPIITMVIPATNGSVIVSDPQYAIMPQTGRRLVVHDNNIANLHSNYAAVYESIGDGDYDLTLAAYDYLTDTQQFMQVIVPAAEWQSADGWNNYVLSNVIAAQFWLVYQQRTTAIAAKMVTFAYNPDLSLRAFLVGPTVVLASGLPPMANNVLDALYASDNTLWTAFVYTDSSNVQNIYLTQSFVNGTIHYSHTIPLPSISGLIWNVQLVQTTSRILVWASSNSHSVASVQGRIYDTGGQLLYTTVQFTYLYSTALSMMNGSAAIIFPMKDTTWMDIVTVSDGHAISEDYSTLGPARYMTDVSAFNLPDNYIGIYFTTLGGFFMSYYMTGGFFGWITPWTILIPASGCTFGPVSADRESLVQNLPAHPAAWLFTQRSGDFSYFNLVLLDIPVVNQLTTVTVQTSETATAMTTLYHTVYSFSSTVAVTSNVLTVTASKLQTPAFQFSLVILTLLILVPAGIGGRYFGILGMMVGAIGGVAMGRIIGTMPDWLAALIVFLLLVSVVLFRQKGFQRG